MDLSKTTELYSNSGVYPNIPLLIKEMAGFYPSQIHKSYNVADFDFDFLKDLECLWELTQNTEADSYLEKEDEENVSSLFASGEGVESFLGLPDGYSKVYYQIKDGHCKLMKDKDNSIFLLVKNTKEGDAFICNFSIYYDLNYDKSVDLMIYFSDLFNKKRKTRVGPAKPKMHLVCASNYGFHKRPFDMKDNSSLSKELLQLHYGDEILEKEEKVLTLLSRKEPALILFSGEPGTGKTSFIRHLVSELKNEKFLYMPPIIANEIGSPNFLPFLLQNPGEICVLEDAELALMARDDGNHSSAISNLLGASDGLLGDALQLKFICSFNTDTRNIDQALVRKGRLGNMQHFEKLSKENSDRLLEHLGKARLGKSLTLAEIYNQEDNGFKKKETRSVRFQL